MTKNTLVDVVTIASDIDENLFTTLANVSQQTYKDINHIIIYRQASDEEINLLQNFSHQKNFVFYAQEGKGIASAFNNGIDRSWGDFVLFLNSGDTLVADNVIDRAVESYLQDRWLWAMGETISVSRNKRLKNHRPQHESWNSSLFLYGNPICHQSTFYSRTLIQQVGQYDESLSLGMDYEYNIRANLVSEPTLLYFPVAYYDTTGRSSMRVFQQFTKHRQIRDRYFKLSRLNQIKVDLYCLIKSLIRLMMIPAKIWL